MDKILQLGVPNIHTVGACEYSDKDLNLIFPPEARPVECTTLQGLVDLHDGELDDAKTKGDLLVHIVSPTAVQLISRESDEHGRRRVWAQATYPIAKTFAFGAFMDPETFIISAQAFFQRTKLETDDGTFARDLDYVLGIASKISAEQVQSNDDDGIAQRVSVRSGVVLKAETALRPLVMLAPYRTFAEVDQVLSRFVFRARVGNDSVTLALFEGDGGRWRLAATDAIAAWLEPEFGDTPVIR
ncbi:MAG: hypothetical protein ACRD4V_07675 [Candidatus Acidiferrales bacterium]